MARSRMKYFGSRGMALRGLPRACPRALAAARAAFVRSLISILRSRSARACV